FTPGDQARSDDDSSGCLAAPRSARSCGPGQRAARGPLQVPRSPNGRARVARRSLGEASGKGQTMRINLTSVMVDDQDKAERFYTEVLGFAKNTEIPMGHHRWLTVVSPDEPGGVELVLEPDEHPAAKPFKQALVSDGIPFTSFAVDDVNREYERLSALGVQFTQPPTEMGPVRTAVLDDTCGNLIQIAAR